MPRDIPIGNGNLLIAFDQDYCIRDIYYPCVGKENHTDGHKFRFGIWIDGKFDWISKDWNLILDYVSESLLTHVTAFNENLGVSLHCNDLIDYRENIYIKKTILKNLSNIEREFRLFFHHDFHILESAIGDTAYFDPDEKAIIHYKGDRYFLMSGIREGRQGIDQYATGIKEFHGLEGTWKDAEDGILEGAPISQGSVDSTIAFSIRIFPDEEQTLNRLERAFETKVTEVIQRTSDVKSFRFAVPEDVEFKPGQFFFVTIRINSREVTKHFTFSNSPTEKGYVEFTKRITDSEFSQTLDSLKAGDWARLKMPYGSFTFEGEYEKVAFLSGGIGITPIRSMCKYVCDMKLSTNMILIYGNRTEKDIVFYEDLRIMEAENKNMKVVYAVGSAIDKDSWKGGTGFITGDMIREEIPDYTERVFFTCGPPKMVDYMVTLMRDEMKIDREKIKWENFPGY